MSSSDEPDSEPTDEEPPKNPTREKLRKKLRAGDFEERTIEIAVEQRTNVVGVLGNQAMEMDVEFQSMFEKMLPTKRDVRKLTVH